MWVKGIIKIGVINNGSIIHFCVFEKGTDLALGQASLSIFNVKSGKLLLKTTV